MHGDMDIVDPAIEAYLAELSGTPDPIEVEMRRYADEREGFPIIGPVVGRLLENLARGAGVRRAFDLGSGFGYSAFWIARALPPGGSVTLTELSRDELSRAQHFLARAGLASLCQFEPGDALDTLARCRDELDLIFLDIEKSDYPRALELSIPRLRKGGLLVADNALWGGSVLRGEADPETEGVREYLRLAHGREELSTSVLPLRDGVAVSWRR